jgi:hypothetical protein
VEVDGKQDILDGDNSTPREMRASGNPLNTQGRSRKRTASAGLIHTLGVNGADGP